MKYARTPAFNGDWNRLSATEKDMFRDAVRRFRVAAEQIAIDPTARWPPALRVRDVEGAPGIWEMTWSFSGPDGRATWQWTQIYGERAILWRRIGRHNIFREP
jgi:hypothetical protein